MSFITTPKPIIGWEAKHGIMQPQPPPPLPEPEMRSFTCGNCGKETIAEWPRPVDLGCEHCGGYNLSITGEEAEGQSDA